MEIGIQSRAHLITEARVVARNGLHTAINGTEDFCNRIYTWLLLGNANYPVLLNYMLMGDRTNQ